MRLIDADALKIELAILHGGDYKTIHYLNHARTVDAVPVIRCKDCKYYTGYECQRSKVSNIRVITNEDDYCSRAERKEE